METPSVPSVVGKTESAFTNYILPGAGFVVGWFMAPVLLTPVLAWIGSAIQDMTGKSLAGAFGAKADGVKVIVALGLFMAGFAAFGHAGVMRIIGLVLLGMGLRCLMDGVKNTAWSG